MSDLTPQPAGTTPAPAEPAAQPPAPPSAASFTQDDLNRIVAEERRKWQQAQKDATDKAKREADEQARVKAGEFEAVATERQQRLSALEAEHTTATERVTAMTEAMERQIKARLKALPEELRDLIGTGDVLAQYEQLGKLEAAAAKLAPAQPAPRVPGGTPSGPRTTTSAPAAPNLDQTIEEKRRQIGTL